ncbi:MAG: tRNA uracil 4-sulfurtransferase ThiI [Longimicrobiales bacterium]
MQHSNLPLYLLRLAGETSIKSKRTRAQFQRRLVHNLRDALHSLGGEFDVTDEWARLYVRTAAPEAPAVLAHIFGVSSFSRVDAIVPAELDAIVQRGESLYSGLVVGRRYAVRARRAGRHGFSSQDVQVELGRALNRHGTVDLGAADVEVFVEVRDEQAFLFADRTSGAGGLPLGVEGHALALISGGFDSAVAAWLVMKRGVSLDYVFCNLGGDAYERAVLQVVKVLADEWSHGDRPRLHVVPFGNVLDALRAGARERYWQVVLKRLMYRTASRIAEERGAAAIVTGEAIGQVSSQTLDNLRAIEPAASVPVLRPLLGFDKDEIIGLAQRIGTAALSEQVKEYCAIAPGHPVTAAKVESVDRQEQAVDLSTLDRALGARKVLDLRSLVGSDLVAPYLFTSDVPEHAIVIDCRPEAAFRAWHHPRAEHHDEWALLQAFRRLDRDRTYILYCAHGVQSAYLAERMQRHGYEAYSFRGGARALMRLANEGDGADR